MATPSLREKYPELYYSRPAPDPKNPLPRKEPMRLLNLSLSRSATMSMRAALKILGIRCYHYVEILAQQADLHYWDRFLERRYPGVGPSSNPINPKPVPVLLQRPSVSREEFELVLSQYGATSDIPSCVFGPELVAAYPEAKVLIIQRAFDRWYPSFKPVILGTLADWKSTVGCYLAPDAVGSMVHNAQRILRGPWATTTGTAEQFERQAPKMYQEHYDDIRALVPKEKLLEYELGSGWEPLCEFLGCEVPDVPFPRVNEAAEIQERLQLMLTMNLKRGLVTMLTKVAMVVAPAVGAWWYYS